MKTLYRKFILATLVILISSITAGFVWANFIYLFHTKQKIDQQNVEIALEIVHNLEQLHAQSPSFGPYLESFGKLG